MTSEEDRNIELPQFTTSIVIPVFGGWTHARALVDGLLVEEAFSGEIVVVDDASPDTGADQFRADYPTVRVETRGVNGGFAAAVNTGLGLATGDVVAVVNSDVLISSGALRALALSAWTNPGTIVGPQARLPDGRAIETRRRFPTTVSVATELVLPLRVLRRARRRHDQSRVDSSTELLPADWVLGACLVFRREVVDRVGLFDETYGMYSEEIDWQLRASQSGVTVRYAAQITVVHDEGHGTRRSDVRTTAIWRARLR